MAKAVLVMDMPERCAICDFTKCEFTSINKWKLYCTKDNKCRDIPNIDDKPDWCPLIPEPPQATPDNSDMSIEWNMGWNACIDALEGKT